MKQEYIQKTENSLQEQVKVNRKDSSGWGESDDSLVMKVSKLLLNCCLVLFLQHLHVHVLPRKVADFEQNDRVYDEVSCSTCIS